jgi:aspartokinase
MEKLKIGGLKQSLELCQFDIKGRNSSEKIVSRVTKFLASHKINIDFLTCNPNSTRYHQFTFCVSQDKVFDTSKLLKAKDALPTGWEVDCREHVGILTVFPHQSALKIVGAIMIAWATHSIPMYGLSTSLSAVSFVTDYRLIEKSVEVIQDSFLLPENRSPLKPELRYYQSDTVKGR